jgi:hypothetical protein
MILIPFSKSSNLLIKVPSLFPGHDGVAVDHEAAMVIQTLGSSCLARLVRAAGCREQRGDLVPSLRVENKRSSAQLHFTIYYLLAYEVENGVKNVDRKTGRI